MTDNDIIKALECCEYCQEDCLCCPLLETEDCYTALRIKTLDLIKRQQAEIEEQDQAIINALKYMGKIRSEAIKEFAERFKRGCGKVKTEGQSMLVCRESSFDNLVKAMMDKSNDGGQE